MGLGEAPTPAPGSGNGGEDQAAPADASDGKAPGSAIDGTAGAKKAADVVTPLERVALWVVVVGLLATVGVITTRATLADLAEYDKTFEFVERQNSCFEDYMLLRAALTPFRSLVFVRSAALFLSFNLVLLGCLF